VSVEWGPIYDGVAGSAVPGGVSAAAVTVAGDMADQDLVGSERWPFGHRPGGWVIHLPLVVRTRSPSIFGSVVGGADRKRPSWGRWAGGHLSADQFFIPFRRRLFGPKSSPHTHSLSYSDNCELHHTDHQHRP
jgi:hypothetical protein